MFKETFLLLLFHQRIACVSKNNVKYFLYNQSTNDPISVNPDDPLQTIDSSYPTKIIIHGWHDNAQLPWIQKMASSYNRKSSYNVIAVDWSKDASSIYLHSAAATRSVGSILGDFIVKITQKTDNFLEKLHLVGHSLGAQIAGFAGRKILSSTGEKIDRITGLDAAGILFEIPLPLPENLHLDQNDAEFVDNIHTAIGLRGYIGAYGTVDFYMNGGGSQLNCTDKLPDIDGAVSCDHQSSHFYFTETILEPKKYKGVRCDGSIRFNLGLCNGNPEAYVGDEVTRDARGKYFVKADENGD